MRATQRQLSGTQGRPTRTTPSMRVHVTGSSPTKTTGSPLCIPAVNTPAPIPIHPESHTLCLHTCPCCYGCIPLLTRPLHHGVDDHAHRERIPLCYLPRACASSQGGVPHHLRLEVVLHEAVEELRVHVVPRRHLEAPLVLGLRGGATAERSKGSVVGDRRSWWARGAGQGGGTSGRARQECGVVLQHDAWKSPRI